MGWKKAYFIGWNAPPSREAYEAAMTSEVWKRTREDGPVGFDSSTLVGGMLEEHVVSWDARSDGRLYTAAGN